MGEVEAIKALNFRRRSMPVVCGFAELGRREPSRSAVSDSHGDCLCEMPVQRYAAPLHWSALALTPISYGVVVPVRLEEDIPGDLFGTQIGTKFCEVILNERRIDPTGTYHIGSDLH